MAFLLALFVNVGPGLGTVLRLGSSTLLRLFRRGQRRSGVGHALAGAESSAPSGVMPSEAKGLILARSFDSHAVAQEKGGFDARSLRCRSQRRATLAQRSNPDVEETSWPRP